MPDWCNAGVELRVLAVVNLVVLTVDMIGASSRGNGLTAFVESCSLVEPVALGSLVVLCGLRRYAARIAPARQRLACAVVPAAMAALVLQLLLRFDSFAGGLPHLTRIGGILVSALFGAALQHYFELRTRAYSPALSEARLQALQARIRPHFLFNSLNAVLSLIRSEPRRAETALEDLAELFRVLMRDGRERTSLHDEIRLCKQYLSIEKIRLGERLQVAWDTSGIHDDALRNAQIPALLLQPLLENAVYHGIEQSARSGTIGITVRRARDLIHIVIVNPFHGERSAALGNHMALDNIRSRLALLYDVEAQLTTAVVAGQFEVRMQIPYVKAAP